MPQSFDLAITAHEQSRVAEFCLRNSAGKQLAYRRTDFKMLSMSQQYALFDLGRYLRLYVTEDQHPAILAEVGVCIANEILGGEIVKHLWASTAQRILRIQLPGASDADQGFVAALARVPWETARPNVRAATLLDRNLLVCVVHSTVAASIAMERDADQSLRVLFVFADSRGSQPLGMRQERRKLLELFQKEVYPRRRIEAHFLAHGVTRERLKSQIQEFSGYHVVHWSGHGHVNQLELCRPNGLADTISGEELLDLFNEAGGFIPHLFFLSACHSGEIFSIQNWNDFFAAANSKEPTTEQNDFDPFQINGYTGTAHALLQGGVPTVVAMRYSVGDDYARELAVAFYRALFAPSKPKTIAMALTLARRVLRDPKLHRSVRFSLWDHATPVHYGAEHFDLLLPEGRSPCTNLINRRLHSVAELRAEAHENFVGRIWELTNLGANFVGAHQSAEAKPIVVIVGLGGMGKTALIAEALDLWESSFNWVLLYHSKSGRLDFESTLRDIHGRLMGELQHYYNHVRSHPADAIYREASSDFNSSARVQRLIRNLIRALRDEPILLVLDNFEINLEKPNLATQSCACHDPAWDDCLALLARELIGSPSRVVIGTRRPLSALPSHMAHILTLGPLSSSEAILYLKEHPGLSAMLFGKNESERALAIRLLEASRLHPLLMDRLAKLVILPAHRAQLLTAIEALEQRKGLVNLPTLFAAASTSIEQSYIEDALATSLEHFISDLSPGARALLWIISVASQPESIDDVFEVWCENSPNISRNDRITFKLDRLLPEKIPKGQVVNKNNQAWQAFKSLLSQMASLGLVTVGNAPLSTLSCHELVCEGIKSWISSRADECELGEDEIRRAYGDRLERVFRNQRRPNPKLAIDAGIRALLYFAQARDWRRLSEIAGGLTSQIRDPKLLSAVIPHLQMAATCAPEGRIRRVSSVFLADALKGSDHADISLPLYEQAVAETKAIAESDTQEAILAWSDLAWMYGNWAIALVMTGNLVAAKQQRKLGIEAHIKSGSPAPEIIACELEALRIDIHLGNSNAALLKQVKDHVEKLQSLRTQRQSAGSSAVESISQISLALISGLNIATHACFALKDWSSALTCVNKELELKKELQLSEREIAETKINRANVLINLNRLTEARHDLEECLSVMGDDPYARAKVLNSIANLFATAGDPTHAIDLQRRALMLCEQLSDPVDRATAHNNLAESLRRAGKKSTAEESVEHRLAAFIYCFVVKHGQHLQNMLAHYVAEFHRAHAAGTKPWNPRVADLISSNSFAELRRWLRQQRIDVDDLQVKVDQFFHIVHQMSKLK